MSRYSGEGSVDVYIDVNISKFPNSMLSCFEKNQDKNSMIDVWIENNKIVKFYFNDLELDLKDKISEKLTKYLINYYENSGNLLRELELKINYYVDGYYHPGNYYGDPSDCYPEESEETREVTSAHLKFSEASNDSISLEIPREYCEKVYDTFEDKINGNYFDFSNYDYDNDYYYDR